MLIMMPTILRLRLPSATTSVGRKHRCIPYVPGGIGGRTGRKNAPARSNLHAQRLRCTTDAPHQGGCGLFQTTCRSLRQMARLAE